MGHLSVSQGSTTDITFKLLDKSGGNLVDDEDWVDGSTAEEWPTVKFYHDGVDVTSDWVKDISNATIDDATHKHPDGTTGIWRDEKGIYNVRVEPTTDTDILPLDDYDLDVTYDVSGTTFNESHTVALIEAGDVDFGDAINSAVQPGDVKAGIDTTLTDTEIQDLIDEAVLFTEGELDACGINVDELNPVPAMVQTAIIHAARALVLQRDLGAGVSISSVREGNKRIDYNSGNSAGDKSDFFWSLWERSVDRVCKSEGLGSSRMKVTKKKTWDQVYGVEGRNFGTRSQRSDD